DGELFTFDADMEWDIGTPWYRPTRVCHVVGGADYGWRSGNGKWPEYYVDSLPPVVNVGPGSPTGVTMGRGTRFPAEYRDAMFIADWSYGRVFVANLKPKGASYEADLQQFATASPLGVTDLVVRPQDGALYLSVGGRQTQSAVYRIVYDGPMQTSSTSASSNDAASQARALRQRLASASPDELSIDEIWPHLSSNDRFVRSAARCALEKRPIDGWFERGLVATDGMTRLQTLVAAARVGSSEIQSRWVQGLVRIPFDALSTTHKLTWLRTAALGVMRFDPIDSAAREAILNVVDKSFPLGDSDVDREFSHLLVRLKAPNLPARLLDRLETLGTQEETLDAAIALSVVSDGWTQDDRVRMLDWFDEAATLGGGRSSFGYLVAARDKFNAGIQGPERVPLAERLNKPYVNQPAELASANRPIVQEWKLDELVALAQSEQRRPDFEAGKKLFAAASCYQCHRIAGVGSAIGPDLTGVAHRFSLPDLLRSIVEPSHTISDQYQKTVFEVNGRLITGRVSNMSGDSLAVSTNMLDAKSEVSIRREDIEDQYPSKTSIMPEGLLNTLNKEEVIDLLGYLRAGGDANDPVYAP
ncbi:MAG: c-type cytochrome, partial [Planctomycetales bacterium]|nr:c-type cytochrome [Planctomycetales bacterium]